MHYDICEMVDLTVAGYIFFECGMQTKRISAVYVSG